MCKLVKVYEIIKCCKAENKKDSYRKMDKNLFYGYINAKIVLIIIFIKNYLIHS